MTPVKLIKLKNGEDIVAYMIEDNPDYLVIKQPIVIAIENEPSIGRQMMNAREWIPPIVAATDSTILSREHIMFIVGVKDSFAKEYKDVVDYFYSVTPKNPTTKSDAELAGKVIPFASVMKDPSNKPN